MSLTAYDHDAACKCLGEAGFTEAQVAALSEFTRRREESGGPSAVGPAIPVTSARHTHHQRDASIAHTVAMLSLAVGGVGALLAILIRVA